MKPFNRAPSTVTAYNLEDARAIARAQMLTHAHPDLNVRREPLPHDAQSRTTTARLVERVRTMWPGVLGPLLPVVCATVLWAASLPGIDLSRMNDLGLVSVLPPATYIALALLLCAFCMAVSRRQLNETVLLVEVGILIVMLYGTTALIEQEPRFPVAWRHLGIAEYIMRTGRVDPSLNAYFNWPGFFILAAFLTRVLGLQSAIGLVAWAPVYFNLLYLAPLVLFMRAVTADRRLVWLGVWVFYLTNWIGQDYFSPQGFIYWLHLVILGVLLRWFAVPGEISVATLPRWRAWWRPSTGESPAPATPRERVGLLLLVVVLYGAAVMSHQLTPFATLAAVTALAAFRCITPRGLPLLLGLMLVTWIGYMTVAYLAGHMAGMLREIGAVHEVVGADVSEHLGGSTQHAFIAHERIMLTLAVCGLAGLGVLRRLHAGRQDLVPLLLVVAPLPLLALQSYGGEMLLRVYLFALPPVACFVAATVFPSSTQRTSWHAAAVGALSCMLLGGFLFARYGNERMDYITHREVKAIHHLYAIAPPGSVIVGLSPYMPWNDRAIEQYDLESEFTLDLQPSWARRPLLERGDVQPVVQKLQSYCPRRSYFIVTREQMAAMELYSGVPHPQIVRLHEQLLATPRLRLIFNNGDAQILVLRHGCAP
jgi:hypothetical protein